MLTAPTPVPEAPEELWDYFLLVPHDLRAAGIARSTLRSVLAVYGLGHLTEVAELIASELVGNALRHSDGPVQLWLRREETGIRIAVTDHSPEKPEFADPEEEAEGGRGLYLVSSLATDWGYCVIGEELFGIAGKLVWADLPVPVAS